MTSTLLVASLAVLGGWAPADTAVTLHRGDRVEVRDLGGQVSVETWNRATLEITGEDSDARSVSVSRTGDRVLIEPGDRRRRGRDVDMAIRVPPWVSLDIQGRTLDVRVSGVAGAVSVRNVRGDIRVERTSGNLDLNTVEGEVEVVDARGRVSAHSRGDDVRLTRVEGDVDAGTGNGDVRLEDVKAASVKAETLDGDVYFSGPLVHGGQYAFSVHDGDATLVIPRSSSAHVRVATYEGEFSSDFPVTLDHYTGEGRFDFTVGDGGAEVSLEVFDGEIRVRAGEAGDRGNMDRHGDRRGPSVTSIPAGTGRRLEEVG